jgi:hypothetical protein
LFLLACVCEEDRPKSRPPSEIAEVDRSFGLRALFRRIGQMVCGDTDEVPKEVCGLLREGRATQRVSGELALAHSFIQVGTVCCPSSVIPGCSTSTWW